MGFRHIARLSRMETKRILKRIYLLLFPTRESYIMEKLAERWSPRPLILREINAFLLEQIL